jgi:hypothetical protein
MFDEIHSPGGLWPMSALDQIDRAVVRFINASNLWALDTPFEPLATARRRAEPATDGDVTRSSLEMMESTYRRVVTGMRNWMLAGVCLLFAFPLAVVLAPEPALLAALVAVVCSSLAWLAWIVVAVMSWRAQPGWGLADRVLVALKRGKLGEDATGAIASLPTDSLLLLMFQPLLKRDA